MQENTDKLRDEILEAQKIRADLVKWKLISVAGIGAAALGLKNLSIEEPLLLFSLIPFACLYVDAETRHLNLRMLVIAAFIRQQDKENNTWCKLYEEYVHSQVRDKEIVVFHQKFKIFSLEDLILQNSTIFLSCLILIAGFVHVHNDKYSHLDFDSHFLSLKFFMLFGSGIVGILFSLIIHRFFNKATEKINKEEKKIKENRNVLFQKQPLPIG
jgi:hypothetical protein